MLVLAMLLVATGLGAVAASLARTRRHVLAAETAVAVEPGDREGDVQPSLLYRALEPLGGVAGRLGRALSPRGRVQLLRRRIVEAGLEGSLTPERLFARKVAGAVVALLADALVLMLGGHGRVFLFIGGVAVAVGFFGPDLVLDSKARARQRAIARDLPEALDLLAITVEAGLGLEQALDTVSANVHGPLADEIVRLLREIELGVTRREALAALRERTSVAELSAFVVALMQADAMGIAIAEVLKVQAAQVRLKRRQKAREQAAKTPVKILFPVIFGILPALMVVVLGPAVVTIAQNLVGRH